MCKFKTNITLSNKELKGKRADLVTQDVKSAAENTLRELKDQKRTLEREKMNYEDLGPENAQSLRPTSKDFDPNGWFKGILEIDVRLEILNRKITIAEGIYNDYFEEKKTSKKSSEGSAK